MPSLLSAALGLFLDSGMNFIWLGGFDGSDREAMFPDPIVAAKDAELFQTLHILCCADTGADPAYISVRRVVDWLKKAEHYPGYINADGSPRARKSKAAHV
jgi:hypothetical protein